MSVSEGSRFQARFLPPDESTELLYTNFVAVGGTRTDAAIQLGRFLPDADPEVRPFAVLQMSWAQARALRDLLNEALDNYDAVSAPPPPQPTQ
jgi:hypothetical protein